MTRDNYQEGNLVIPFRRFTDKLKNINDTRNRRHLQWIKTPGAATILTLGLAAPTIDFGTTGTTGAASTSDGVTGPGIILLSSTTSGESAWIVSSTFAEFRRDWEPSQDFALTTGPAVTTVRLWAGMFSATPKGTATLFGANIHGLGFRYDTAQDTGGAFWTCVSGNNTVVDAETITAVAVAANTRYTFRIDTDTTLGEAYFYINDALVAVHTLHLPTSTQLMGKAYSVTTLAASSRRLIWHRSALTTN